MYIYKLRCVPMGFRDPRSTQCGQQLPSSLSLRPKKSLGRGGGVGGSGVIIRGTWLLILFSAIPSSRLFIFLHKSDQSSTERVTIVFWKKFEIRNAELLFHLTSGAF